MAEAHLLYLADQATSTGCVPHGLQQAGYRIEQASFAAALAHAIALVYPVVVIDQVGPGDMARHVSTALLAADPAVLLIVLVDTGQEPVARAALQAGASEYVIKDCSGGYLELLPVLIERALQRRQAEMALRERAEYYRTVADWTYDWEYWIDPTGQTRYVSPACERITGYRPDAFQADPALLQTIVHPDDRANLDVHLDAELKQDAAMEVTFRVITRSGAERWIAHACQPMYAADGTWFGRRASNRDITTQVLTEQALRASEERYRNDLEQRVLERTAEYRQAEQRLIRANRLYAVLSRIGEAVIRLADQHELFATVCRIAVEQGLFKMVWVGLLDAASQMIQPVVWSGVGTEYLEQLRITARDEDQGRGPTGTAVREGRSVVCNDICNDPRMHLWQALARTYGFRSSAAFPITVHGSIIGSLSLYSGEVGFFDAAETDLLERVVGNLSFALEKLDEEGQRRQIEAARRSDIARQEALLKLSEMTSSSEREIVEFALEEAVRITHSTIGYLHFINEDQVSLQLFTWSKGVRKDCYAEETTHYPLEQAGVWVDCVRQRQPVFHNDYQALPDKKGYPAGHIHLERHLSVPLIEGDKVVAVTGVGNKVAPYEEADARQLLLFMNGMWGVLQRKRVAAALRESEERYRRLTENAPDIIYRIQVHPVRQFEYVSPAVTTVTGFTPEDHYADPDLGFKLIHPDDQQVLTALAQGGGAFSTPVELRWVAKDGTIVWVEQRNVPIFDEHGTLVAIEGIARDITERRQAEAAYRSLVEHSLQGLLIFQDQRIVFANAMMSEINGYTIDEMLLLSPAEIFALVYPDDQPLVQRVLQARMQGQALPDRYEYRIVRKDGSIRWLEARGVRILYQGRYALQGAYIDITERKLAEQALVAERANMEQMVIQRTQELRRERDRTRAILEALGEAVMVMDMDGAIQYLNPAAIALTGFRLAAWAGSMQHWWWWQHTDLHDPVLQMQLAIQCGASWRGELVLRRVDGTHYDAAMTVAPLLDPDADNQPIGFVSVQHDITTMKTAERLKDQFVSNVSHELRSPMSLITMLIGSLEMLYPRLDDAKRLEIIGDIRKHARVLSTLIADVLEISRIDSGRIDTEQHRLDLAQLAREEIDNLLPIAERKGLIVELDITNRLPIIGHDGQVRQVLRNLINNAIKYTPDGGTIFCRCHIIISGQRIIGAHDADCRSRHCPGSERLPHGRWATVCITDTGIGISAEDLTHIFERFFRAYPQGDIPGTGLGLSIAWELVKRHGGYLEASSVPEQGSSFALYLPLKEEL